MSRTQSQFNTSYRNHRATSPQCSLGANVQQTSKMFTIYLLGLITIQVASSFDTHSNSIPQRGTPIMSEIRREKTRQMLLHPLGYADNDERDIGKNLASLLSPKELLCLLEKDMYCSKSMGAVKRTLKKAIVEECVSCNEEEKAAAGPVMASLVLRHPREWRVLLSRYNAWSRYQGANDE